MLILILFVLFSLSLFKNSRMPRHSCCEVRVMQLHDTLLLRTSAILPEAISAGGIDSQLIYHDLANAVAVTDIRISIQPAIDERLALSCRTKIPTIILVTGSNVLKIAASWAPTYCTPY